MKITGQDPAKAAELNVGPGKGRESKQPEPVSSKAMPQPAPLPTSANLTTNRVREAIRNEPDIRADRVAEVRERIKSGSFRVDADKVAEKMLNSHLPEDLERP